MQICVARMLRESGIFFALLSILGIGFLQGLWALDASDGVTESPIEVIHVMVQALLGSPNFEKFEVRHPNSRDLHEKALTSLPGGNTRTLLYTAPYPIYMRKGESYRLYDEDGNE